MDEKDSFYKNWEKFMQAIVSLFQFRIKDAVAKNQLNMFIKRKESLSAGNFRYLNTKFFEINI